LPRSDRERRARWRAPAHRGAGRCRWWWSPPRTTSHLSLLPPHTAAHSAGTADAHITEARVVALVAATFDGQIMAHPLLSSSSFLDHPLRRASRSDCPFRRHAAFLPLAPWLFLLVSPLVSAKKKRRDNAEIFSGKDGRVSE
jgi:hypothetical protein